MKVDLKTRSSIEMGGQRNGGVDVLRLLMALCVVINHSCILGHYFQNVLEMPVPVFLMLSGYFFNTDDSVKEKNKSKKQLIKRGCNLNCVKACS